MSVSAWMSWENGVDLVAATAPDVKQPNVIVHVARMVYTPVGSAPSGLILFAPAADEPPQIMGFVSGDAKVGAYFGPHIFAGTPFEHAPVLVAKMSFSQDENGVGARIELPDFVIETQLSALQNTELVAREIGALPFAQHGLEAISTQAMLKINGENIALFLPSVGISGGAPAVFSPTGIYAR